MAVVTAADRKRKKVNCWVTDHIFGAEFTGTDIGAVGQPLEEHSQTLLDVGRERQSALGSQLEKSVRHVTSGSISFHNCLYDALKYSKLIKTHSFAYQIWR